MYQWCGFKSCRGKNKNLTALKSNSNTVWFNFQTYIYNGSFEGQDRHYHKYHSDSGRTSCNTRDHVC